MGKMLAMPQLNGKVVLGEVAHGLRRGAGHEPLTGAPVVRFVGHFPVVPHAIGLALGRHVEGVDVVALTIRVLGRRLAVGSEGEPVAPADEPKNVVKRVVLHHQHDEVFDLWHLIGAGSALGIGQRSGFTDALALEDGCGACADGQMTIGRMLRAPMMHRPIHRRGIAVGSVSPDFSSFGRSTRDAMTLDGSNKPCIEPRGPGTHVTGSRSYRFKAQSKMVVEPWLMSSIAGRREIEGQWRRVRRPGRAICQVVQEIAPQRPFPRSRARGQRALIDQGCPHLQGAFVITVDGDGLPQLRTRRCSCTLKTDTTSGASPPISGSAVAPPKGGLMPRLNRVIDGRPAPTRSSFTLSIRRSESHRVVREML